MIRSIEVADRYLTLGRLPPLPLHPSPFSFSSLALSVCPLLISVSLSHSFSVADKSFISLPVKSEAEQTVIMFWRLQQPQLTLPPSEGSSEKERSVSACSSFPCPFLSFWATLWIFDHSADTHRTFKAKSTHRWGHHDSQCLPWRFRK